MCFKSPPKSHGFTSLSLQSTLSVPIELIPWQDIYYTLTPDNITWCVDISVRCFVDLANISNIVSFKDLYQFVYNGGLSLIGSIDYTKLLSVILKSMNSFMSVNYMGNNPIIWYTRNEIAQYSILTDMLNNIPPHVISKLVPVLITGS